MSRDTETRPVQRKTIFLTCVVFAATVFSLLASPAFAEGKSRAGKNPGSDLQSQGRKKKDAELEKAYKDALKKIPDQKPSDPWAKMR
jgi:uncharacterized protein YecT (DUF1311 family)